MSHIPIGALVTLIVEQSGVPEPQARAVLAALAAVTFVRVADGDSVPVPGLGVVQRVERPAREMVMQFGPKKGQRIAIPQSRKLKFRFGTAAMDAILAPGKLPIPDVMTLDMDPGDTDPDHD